MTLGSSEGPLEEILGGAEEGQVVLVLEDHGSVSEGFAGERNQGRDLGAGQTEAGELDDVWAEEGEHGVGIGGRLEVGELL